MAGFKKLTENQSMNKPPPPSHLSKETLIIWEGWSKKGDVEVAREAATKGSHIELAITFLSQRKILSENEAKSWFKDEILSWVLELLLNKQVFRASHILTNINLDPIEEISKMFSCSNHKELRDFLGNHLDKVEKLSESLKLSWQLLKIIENEIKLHKELKEEHESLNIDVIMQKSLDWRDEISAKLFLKEFNITLLPILNPTFLWKHALLTNNTEFLIIWINLQHNPDYINPAIQPELIALLKSFVITDEMVEFISNEPVEEITANTTYNILAGFGIFNKIEQKNLHKLILRLMNIKSIDDIESILNKPSSNVNIATLYELISKHCEENDLHLALDTCIQNHKLTNKSDAIELINSNRNLVANLNNKRILQENILRTCKYTNTTTDSLINLFIIYLSSDSNLCRALSNKNQFGIDVTEIFSNLKLLKNIYDSVTRNKSSNPVTMYDLLEKHMGIDTKLFSKINLPHFNQETLVKQFGYKKQLDYTFYIRQSRPSEACALYNTKPTNNVDYKVLKIAIKDFLNPDVTSSCVAFLEMIGSDSDCLRLTIKAANMIYKSLKVDQDGITNMFLSVSKKKVVSNFETVVCNSFENSEDVMELYDYVIRFAKLYKLKLPDLLLQRFAAEGNWLSFLVMLQKYSYPLDEACRLTQFFKNEVLLEHLQHCLQNEIMYEHNSIMKDRDSRKYYLSRIGVRKNIENDSSMVSSITSLSSYGSTSSSGHSDVLDFDVIERNVDVLQMVIKCHNTSDPYKSLLQACQYYKYPFFAILATIYDGESIVVNWITWLGVMCKIEPGDSYEKIADDPKEVTDFLATVLQKGFYQALEQGFTIFFPNHPLKTFATMLSQSITPSKTETTSIQTALQEFQQQSEQTDQETFITTQSWVETTALALLTSTLQHQCGTKHHQLQLLHTLQDAQKYFTITTPNFKNLLLIEKYFFERRIPIQLNYTKISEITSYMDEIKLCISKLTDDEMFEEALTLAQLENISNDEILMKKWKQLFETQQWPSFWTDCDNAFKKYQLSPKSAVIFYTECSEASPIRYKILQLAYDWAYRNNLETLDVVEKKMWDAYLELDDDTVDIPYNNDKSIYFDTKSTLVRGKGSSNKKLDGVIQKLLLAGDILQAFRLERLFDANNPNLENLRICFNMAENVAFPVQLSVQERLLYNKTRLRGFNNLRKSYLSRNLSTASRSPGVSSLGSVTEIEITAPETGAQVLEMFLENVSLNEDVKQRIVLIARISKNIVKPFTEVLTAKRPIALLLEAIQGDCLNKLEVVQDFILAYKWSKQEIADFLCEQIIITVARNTKDNMGDDYQMWDTDIHLILQLLPDCCSILGNKLYHYASALHKVQTVSNEFPDMVEITHVVELLIRAHDCFTADCNMVGISVILKKCNTLTNLFLTMKCWKLIVRMLTGVARYNEMNYIFHILRENDQFEYLLSKGVARYKITNYNSQLPREKDPFEYLLSKGKIRKKDNGLKVALLEYLKKYCPDNRELYRMVALHFALFSEVAQLWETESENIIRNLIEISKLEMQNRNALTENSLFIELSNTDGTRLSLNKVMENYTHAAEYHLQGEILARAMAAARQAELIALQISLLKGVPANATVKCILNLISTQITLLIMNEFSFPQALILTEAYSHQVDWAAVVYEQYIVQNRFNYLANFLSAFPLTEILVHDISRRFLLSNSRVATATNNMKALVNMLPSVHTKYRIASELRFVDIIEELLDGNKLMYVKDTVWKRGYKN